VLGLAFVVLSNIMSKQESSTEKKSFVLLATRKGTFYTGEEY
jgi:hypothetical protein